MLEILINAVLPVFIMAGVGVLASKTLHLDPKTPSRLALYVFSPILIFSSLYSSDIPFQDVRNLFAFLVLWFPLLFAACWAVAWQIRLKGPARAAFLLSTLFQNAVNYGLPVTLYAFGQEGMQRALLFLAPQALLSGTLAIYVASSGTASGLKNIITVLRMPMFYATLGALAINPFHIVLPNLIATSLKTLADAAIPTMIMVLGIQLANVSIKDNLLPSVVATVVRLALSPALAFGVTLLLGVHGVTQKVVIVVAGMPTAVFTTILATEFDTQPRQVTNTVALSTAASLATITGLIWFVERFL
ncbi:MAG: AEC family transporter [Chloroflexota bacterium]